MHVTGGMKRFLAISLVAFAVVRWVLYRQMAPRTDSVFLGLVGAALLVYLIPWERLRSLKAAGIEVTLSQPQVQGAIAGLALRRVEDRQLRSSLEQLGDMLQVVDGARLLWIDDRPWKLVGVRRLLRALGAEIVMADSSCSAERTLLTDNDFDLLLTDVQREGTVYQTTGGEPIHDGANFIVKLRSSHPDHVVRSIPVVFYAAYDWPRLVEFTQAARGMGDDIDISNSVIDLIPKVVRQLSLVRERPIETDSMKDPTDPRWKGAT